MLNWASLITCQRSTTLSWVLVVVNCQVVRNNALPSHEPCLSDVRYTWRFGLMCFDVVDGFFGAGEKKAMTQTKIVHPQKENVNHHLANLLHKGLVCWSVFGRMLDKNNDQPHLPPTVISPKIPPNVSLGRSWIFFSHLPKKAGVSSLDFLWGKFSFHLGVSKNRGTPKMDYL